MTHFPGKIWDGAGPRRVPKQFSEPSPEDWNQIVTEVVAVQEFLGAGDRTLTTELDDVLQQAKVEKPLVTPYTYGQQLSAVTPNGVTTINLAWTPPRVCKCLIQEIQLAYRTLPDSTLGTILFDVFRLRGGAPQSLLLAPISLEADNLAPGVWKTIPLTNVLGGLYTSDGDYFYATITSNNTDAVDGSGGGLALSYGLC